MSKCTSLVVAAYWPENHVVTSTTAPLTRNSGSSSHHCGPAHAVEPKASVETSSAKAATEMRIRFIRCPTPPNSRDLLERDYRTADERMRVCQVAENLK